VVESFVGDGPYTLEIVVQPLFLASSASALTAAPQAGVTGVNARAERATAAETGYLREKPAGEPLVAVEQLVEIDPETGTVLEIVRVRRSDD
jgi:hypothetical protein